MKYGDETDLAQEFSFQFGKTSFENCAVTPELPGVYWK